MAMSFEWKRMMWGSAEVGEEDDFIYIHSSTGTIN